MNYLIFQRFVLFVVVCCFAWQPLLGQEVPGDAPRVIPMTRPLMKQMIEEIKQRRERIPLQPADERIRDVLGERANDYETRLRYDYLNEYSVASSGEDFFTRPVKRGARPQDPESTLNYAFKVQLFWIVSRANNCQYCIGHQETKLLAAGIPELTIAAMDCDWSRFSEKEQAAFAFAKKFTSLPRELSRADIEALKKHFTEKQILEMCLSMSWNNSINRWKEAIGVRQSEEEGGYSRLLREYAQKQQEIPEELANLPVGSYLTETPEQFLTSPSIIVPQLLDGASSEGTGPLRALREGGPSMDEVEKILGALSERDPVLPLVDPQVALERFELSRAEPVPSWMRLMAVFPVEGVERGKRLLALGHLDAIPPRLKAEIQWIVARQDNAWYGLGTARRELLDAGYKPVEIRVLDGDWSEYARSDQAVFQLARHLAASPVTLTERQVSEAIAETSPKLVVQVIELVTQLAALNRLAEAAQLPLE